MTQVAEMTQVPSLLWLGRRALLGCETHAIVRAWLLRMPRRASS
jgi:hypothetical protein